MMKDFSLNLPSDFSEYEWEVEIKGCFFEAKLFVFEKCYKLSFYDPARLNQEIGDMLNSEHVFFESNLVVIKSVTKSNMEDSVEMLIKTGKVNFLTEYVEK